jgi:hypothetical protein
MTISSDIYTYLTGYAALKALISDRLYPVVDKVGATVPFIVFDKNAQDEERAMGALVQSEASYSFYVVASTHATMESTADVLKTALRAMTGTVGSSTIRDVVVRESGQGFVIETGNWQATVEADIMFAP